MSNFNFKSYEEVHAEHACKTRIMQAATEAAEEAKSAREKWPPYNSAHEAFAILLEEVDELKEQVWLNQTKRDIEKMKKEATQVAAVALRFIAEICNEEKGRK